MGHHLDGDFGHELGKLLRQFSHGFFHQFAEFHLADMVRHG